MTTHQAYQIGFEHGKNPGTPYQRPSAMHSRYTRQAYEDGFNHAVDAMIEKELNS